MQKSGIGNKSDLRFLLDKIKGLIFVSNCDIIIDCDFQEIIHFHKSNNYDMTIVGSFRHFTIPYGICHIEDGGRLVKIDEKPEYDFLVNTGMYLMDKGVFKYIPKNEFFDIPDLVKKIHREGGKIGVFPINEKAWIDVGQWEEYHRALKLLGING